MTDGMTLSPEALAAISVPEGVMATTITGRDQWMALRRPLVTASVAAALFGDCHPYQTAYGLWAAKSGLAPEDKTETPAMKRGRMLEPVILEMLREEFPDWQIVSCRKFYHDQAARIGATPDFLAIRPDISGLGLIQAKSVGKFAFKKGWQGADGDIEIPLWVAVQASIEAGLTGATWACATAMALGDGGLDLHVEDIPLRHGIMPKFRELAAEFWGRIADERPYPPDFGRDAALIAKVFGDDGEPEVSLAGNPRMVELVAKREKLKATEKAGAEAATERKAIDSELVYALGNAARGRLADGRIVEAKVTKRGAYEVKASQFRTIRIKQGEAA